MTKSNSRCEQFSREGASASVSPAPNGENLEVSLSDGRNFKALVLDKPAGSRMAALISEN